MMLTDAQSSLFKLPIPSDEQREILLSFRQGFNCKIDALAGAGKSTSLLLLASEAKTAFGARTLIITYNKDLKNELSEKIQLLGLDSHCEAYTYHGYASRIYKRSIHNDKILRECLNMQVLATSHDIILLDEVQDMNEDYHKLVSKIISHGKLFVLVGDKRQCINEYIGATTEYLVNYSKYFNTGRPWKELALCTSYRLTPSLAKFVNKNILCENIIIPGNMKDRDVLPIYSYGAWDIERFVIRNVDKYGPDEVVIMIPSVRNITPKSPVGRLCSKQIQGILFCVNESDIDTETTRGKVLITSYNSMKGRERKCVIVVGLDESYFEYYDKKWSKAEPTLPNILYVAATRAREQLIVIQDSNKERLRTITTHNLYDTCEVHGDNEKKIGKIQKLSNKTGDHLVTDVIRHRNATDTIEMLSLLDVSNVQLPGSTLQYQNTVQFNGYYEDMRRYYGTLIPLLAQYKKTGKIHFAPYNPDKSSDTNVVTRYNGLLELENKTVNQWMELVVLQIAIESNCFFYVYQITNYDWVDSDFITTQVDRILAVINNSAGEFEVPYSISYETKSPEVKLHGIMDYFDDGGIMEFKCATHLSDDNKIQCGVYISMHHVDNLNVNSCGMLPTCRLFNTRTGEIVIVKVTNPEKFLEVLMRHKIRDIGLKSEPIKDV